MTRYLLGAVVRVWRLTFRGGLSGEERRRQRSIAAATAPLHALPMKPDEVEHAEVIHAIVAEYRTGELPKIVEPRRPTVRDIARRYQRKPKHAARKLPKSKRFDPLTSPLPLTEKPVMAPGPAPSWHLESFTESWTSQEIARIVNGAKAAKR